MAEFSAHRPSHLAPSIAQMEDDEIVQRRTFRDYYIILRERVWIALPLALLVAISLGYYQARAPKMYAATATMQFERPKTVVTTQGVVDQSVHSESDLATYLQVLNTSSTLRERVLASMTPDETKTLLRPAMARLKPGDPQPTPGDAMLGSISCEQAGKSYIIDVTARNADPDAAAIVANHYVDQFMQQLIEDAGGANQYAVNYLQQSADELRKESEDADDRLQQYMKDHNLISLDKSMNMITARLESVNEALEAAKLARLRIADQVDQIAAFQAQGRNLIEIDDIAKYGAVGTLRGQLDALLQQQATLAQEYLERHPKMIAIAEQIEVIRAQLAKEVAQAVDDVKAQLGAATQNVQALTAAYDAAEQQELQLKSLSTTYDSLQQDADVARQNYQGIMDRLSQTKTSKDLSEMVPLRPLDKAVPNYSPYQPNLSRIWRTCAGVGVLVFVGVAVGLSFIDDRVKSAWDIEAFIGTTLLGIVPELPSKSPEERRTILLEDKQNVAVESFLSIYSSIKINSKLDFPKSLLITSTIPGEGKTLISSNLAACFARHGKRTLLVDCDLRRPMLHRHFKLQNTLGVITWFEKSGNLDGDLMNNQSLGITKIDDNLWLLSSGGRSKSPTEMLENPMFGQLLEALKKQFDLVVVDSPPMGAVTDALLIAERVDEVAYVCRFNRAYRKHIKLYIRALLNGKNAVLGIVLNGLSPRRIEYYSNYRYYRSYKKYYGAQT